eukprot:symbB.v1.2.030333.t1/scaffold3349.1/size58708/1
MFLKKLHSRTQELGLPEKEDEDPTSSTGSLGRFRGLAATLRRTQSGLRSNSGLSGGPDPPTPKGGWWPMTEAEAFPEKKNGGKQRAERIFKMPSFKEAAEQQEQVVPGSAKSPLSTSGLLSSNSSRPGTGFTEGKERPSGLQSPTSLLSGQSGRSTGRQDHAEATQATQGSPSSRGNSNPRSRVQHASTAPAGPDLEERGRHEASKDDPLPWEYDLAEGNLLPSGKRLLWTKDIAFTQKQVNDSFSHQKRDVMELINGLLSGQVHPRDIPLIRVAWHDGQFWAIDNRRLFCYKHCCVERILVEVIRWEELQQKWGE